MRRVLRAAVLTFAVVPFLAVGQPSPAMPSPVPTPTPGAQPAPSATPPAAPAAAAPGPKPYLLFHLGAFVPTGGELKSDFNVGTGLDFEVGGGGFVTPALALEGTIGRFSVSGTKSVTVPGQGTGDIQTDVSVLSLSAGVRALMPLEKGSVAGLVGLGWFQADSKLDIAAAGINGSKTSSSIGFYLGAAYAYPVNPNFDLGLEAKFLLGPSFDYVDLNQSIAQQGVVEGKAGLSGLRLFGSASYRF